MSGKERAITLLRDRPPMTSAGSYDGAAAQRTGAMMSDQQGAEEGAYQVGYGKPPKEHQFQAGHKKSKGRKRGSRNIRALFEEAVFEPVSYLAKGKKKSAPAMGLIFQQLKNNGLKGDMKAIMGLVTVAMRLLPPPEEEPEVTELTAAEQALVEALLAKKTVLDGEPE